MSTRISGRVLRPYESSDVLAQQRAWVLLLVNTIGFLLSIVIAAFTMVYQGEPLHSPDVWVGFLIAVALVMSTVLLMYGRYVGAAHVTVALTLTVIWMLVFLRFDPLSHRGVIAYVIAVLALPALLLGRFWTVLYGLLSLLLLGLASAQLAQARGSTVKDAVGLGVDVATATVFVVLVTALMTYIYEVVLKRHRDLLAEQQKTNIALLDLTESLERSEAHKRQFYRETIYSVTAGKLSISDQYAIDPLLAHTQLDIDVHDAESISQARTAAAAFLASNGFEGTELECFAIGTGEAITNAVKHADGGRVRCGTRDGDVWVAVTDRGPGIESLILPRAVLLPGFSTKPSLGLGYTIMLDVADRILLKTSESGTTVVLIKKPGGQDNEGLSAWPDAWEKADREG